MFIYILLVIFLFIIAASVSIYIEKREFNDGICIICGNILRSFEDDHDGRGYYCDECGHEIWVSYDVVDKDYF